MSRALPTDLEEMIKKLVYLVKVREVSTCFREAVDEQQKIDLLTHQYELAKKNSEFCANKYETIYQMNRRNINAASVQHHDHAHMTSHREKFYKDYFSKQKDTRDSEVSLVQAAKKKNSLSAASNGKTAHSFFLKSSREDLQHSDALLQLRLKVLLAHEATPRRADARWPAQRLQTRGIRAEHPDRRPAQAADAQGARAVDACVAAAVCAIRRRVTADIGEDAAGVEK